MSYRDFTFPEIEKRLGLSITAATLFADVPAVAVSAEFLSRLEEGVNLGLGIDTEKARSEFILSPIFLEFRRLDRNRHAIFSGIEFNVDPAAGLNGYCDFLITRSPRLYILTAPVIAVAEAKNDNVKSGLGQCIAAMRAAWLFNVKEGTPAHQIYGVTTTGSIWKFLRLQDTQVVLDSGEYYVRDVGQILGILQHMVETA